MQSTEEKKSVRYDNIIASTHGMAEAHGKKTIIFVSAEEIDRVTLKFGKSEYRPALSIAIGTALACIGVWGLIQFFRNLKGFRYESGMVILGVIGASLIFDAMKERYFLEVDKKGGMSRLVFSKDAKKNDIDNFCNNVRSTFNYHIHDSA